METVARIADVDDLSACHYPQSGTPRTMPSRTDYQWREI